jgi:tellurite resistance protein
MQDPGDVITREIDETKLEALVEVVYLAAFADGEFSETERTHFARSVEQLTEGRLGSPRLNEVLTKLRAHLETAGRDACIASIRERLTEPSLRWLAVLLAADMTGADGVIHPLEREMLLSLAAALEVDGEEAERLIEGFDAG